MKPLVFVALLISGFVLSAADLKVATVDMQRLLKEYHRAQEVAKILQERQGKLIKELSDLRLEGQKILDETRQLQQSVTNIALSAKTREETKRNLELQLADLRAFEVRYDETRIQRSAELQNQAATANQKVLDEILFATREIGEREGFNLVLNASKTVPTDVLFAKGVADITEKVLASLNNSKR